MNTRRYNRACLYLLYITLSSIPLLVQAASNEASFTPESIVIPIREIGFRNSVSGVSQPLYTCSGSSESECLVDVTDEVALAGMFSSPSAIDSGSYDQLYVANCKSEGGYSARISGAVNIAGVTYYTTDTTMSSDPLNTDVARKGASVVGFQGCVRTYQLPDSVTVSPAAPLDLSLFIANTNIAWARLGAKTIPSGCIENTSRTQSVCLAYPDIIPYVGSSSPYLEYYSITEKASSNELGGQLLLVVDRNTDAVLAGFTRRYFSKNSKPLSVNFDTPLKTVTSPAGNHYLLENYGSATDNFYVRFPNFIRQTHVASYVTDAGTRITYQAYKSDAQAVVPDKTIPLPIQNAIIDGNSIAIATGGGTVHASIGPFGAHFSPLTGHLWGDGKANFIAYMARSDTDLKPYVDTNANGVCEPASGDLCGFDGGVNGVNISALQPTYIAPADAVVTSIIEESPPGSSSLYLNGQAKWRISLLIANRYSVDFGHVGSIATALKNRIFTATFIDIDTMSITPGVNLIAGASIHVNQGEALAHPQLVASEIAGHPGFYRGGGASDKYPWAQMEFFVVDHLFGNEVCLYDLMSDSDKAGLNTAMINDMSDAQSPRYGFEKQAATEAWKWRAEAVLCTAYTTGSFFDFSSIHSRLGGWIERGSPGITRDELFSIVPIRSASAIYDSANYQPGVTHLVSRQRLATVNNFNWTMPDSTTPGDILYPVGEVLEETANSLLIMWRDFSASYTASHGTSVVYQRAVFQLDSEGLKVKWGAFGDSAVTAIAPVLGSDACNDTDVICYSHQQDLH